MAQSPRKPSSGRPPSDSHPADDLFSGTTGAVPPPAGEPAGDAEEWHLDDGPAPQGKPSTLPTPVAAPRPESVRVSPIAAPEKNTFESNLRPEEPSSIPQALPAPGKAAPAPEPPPAAAELYDPFEIDEELPKVTASPAVAARRESPAITVPASPEPAEEFAAPDADEATAPAAAGPRSRAGLLTAIGMFAAIAALFIGVIYSSRPEAKSNGSRLKPTVPLKGQVITLSSIDSGWRTRQESDLVSTVDVTLPTPSRGQAALLPMVKFSTDASASKTGFLRFIFIDPDGKLSGDVRVIKINGGTIEPMTSGAVTAPDGSAIVYGSFGYMDRPGFVAYATGENTRWSVEVSESSDYNAKAEGWNKLETFNISDVHDH